MISNTLIPVVVEKDPGGQERAYDIYSRLLKDFIVFVTGPIDMGMANTFIAQMLFLESQDDKRDIKVYINSGGGGVYASFAMYDTIRHVKNNVSTINVGLAASGGALLLGAGTKGKRFALPKARTMVHQPLIMGDTGIKGQATDVEITAKEMVKNKQDYAEAVAKATGQSVKKVMEDIERDRWMGAEEAVKYGIIDEVMQPKK
jgi:ATP-dependent Clp protease protease subunit